MQSSITIPIASSDIHRLLRDQEPLLQFFRNHMPALHDLLMDYWFRRRGKVDSLSLRLDRLSLEAPGRGSVVVHYKVLFSFACEDRSAVGDEQMVITFFVDSERKEIVVLGEEERERIDEL